MDCAILIGTIGTVATVVYHVGKHAKEQFELLVNDHPLIPPPRPTFTTKWLSATSPGHPSPAPAPAPGSIGNFFSIPNNFSFDMQTFNKCGVSSRIVMIVLLVSILISALYLLTIDAHLDVTAHHSRTPHISTQSTKTTSTTEDPDAQSAAIQDTIVDRTPSDIPPSGLANSPRSSTSQTWPNPSAKTDTAFTTRQDSTPRERSTPDTTSPIPTTPDFKTASGNKHSLDPAQPNQENGSSGNTHEEGDPVPATCSSLPMRPSQPQQQPIPLPPHPSFTEVVGQEATVDHVANSNFAPSVIESPDAATAAAPSQNSVDINATTQVAKDKSGKRRKSGKHPKTETTGNHSSLLSSTSVSVETPSVVDNLEPALTSTSEKPRSDNAVAGKTFKPTDHESLHMRSKEMPSLSAKRTKPTSEARIVKSSNMFALLPVDGENCSDTDAESQGTSGDYPIVATSGREIEVPTAPKEDPPIPAVHGSGAHDPPDSAWETVGKKPKARKTTKPTADTTKPARFSPALGRHALSPRTATLGDRRDHNPSQSQTHMSKHTSSTTHQTRSASRSSKPHPNPEDSTSYVDPDPSIGALAENLNKAAASVSTIPITNRPNHQPPAWTSKPSLSAQSSTGSGFDSSIYASEAPTPMQPIVQNQSGTRPNTPIASQSQTPTSQRKIPESSQVENMASPNPPKAGKETIENLLSKIKKVAKEGSELYQPPSRTTYVTSNPANNNTKSLRSRSELTEGTATTAVLSEAPGSIHTDGTVTRLPPNAGRVSSPRLYNQPTGRDWAEDTESDTQ